MKLYIDDLNAVVCDISEPNSAFWRFSNFKYFNTVFRRYEGVSPGRYTKTLFNEAKQTYGDFLEENKGLH